MEEDFLVSKDTFIRGRDVFERMNYLYQLSYLWSNTNPDISAYYAKLMLSISKKSVLRLDQTIKRTICKGCCTYLVDGRTCRSKYIKEHRGQLLKTCNRCGVQKRFPVSKIKELA